MQEKAILAYLKYWSLARKTPGQLYPDSAKESARQLYRYPEVLKIESELQKDFMLKFKLLKSLDIN